MSKLRGNVAIAGIGEVPTGRFPKTGAISFALESARMAIADAGLTKDDIDYVIPTGALFNAPFNTELVTGRIVEELGLKNVRKNIQVFSGGSSSSNALQIAGALVYAGLAKNVLFVHADKLGTGVTAQGGIDLFSTAGISSEWEVPYGQHYSTVAALATRMCALAGRTRCLLGAVRLGTLGHLLELTALGGLVAVTTLEIRNFKQIVDNFDHPVSDLLFKLMAERVADLLTGEDSVALFGEDRLLFSYTCKGGESFSEDLMQKLLLPSRTGLYPLP